MKCRMWAKFVCQMFVSLSALLTFLKRVNEIYKEFYDQ